MNIRVRRDWELPERQATPETVYWNRRQVLKRLGFAGAGAGLLGAGLGVFGWRGFGDDRKSGSGKEGPAGQETAGWKAKLFPAKRSEAYQLERHLTPEKYATSYNNFYEFGFDKSTPRARAQKLVTEPWKLEVGGLVKKPQTLDADDLLRLFPLEERLYRFRCVEAWAMAVPWTGIPLKSIIDKLEPLGSAKFVRLVTFHRPQEAPMQNQDEWPWPYHEALRLDEATNELAFLAFGLYGKILPKQNGAPLRLVVPWKYGFKSIKSIVKLEFVEKRPATFWNTLIPEEYDFYANVNPNVPHPRWSQASERLIDTGERRPTLLYNGYDRQVSHLYKS